MLTSFTKIVRLWDLFFKFGTVFAIYNLKNIKRSIMKQEDKDLLLKDLCSRLPYGVKCSFGVDDAIYEVCGVNPTCCGASEIQATHVKSSINGDFSLSSCKPYLFPLSSMTAEQKREYVHIVNSRLIGMTVQDWFSKNHFDYRGLIPMGLAIDATGKNIY